MSKYKGKCKECKYRDVVNKKWWGCTTVVCTFNSQMGKALPPTENIPAWCPNGGVPKVKEEENKKSISCNRGMTNFKKVSKNAEELAKFLGSYYNDNDCNYCAFHGTKECEESTCEKGLVAWLNSEVKE